MIYAEAMRVMGYDTLLGHPKLLATGTASPLTRWRPLHILCQPNTSEEYKEHERSWTL